MKAVIFCIIAVVLSAWITELYMLAPPFAGKYSSFMDGVDYKVTPRYYVKEITSIIGGFITFLSFSVLVVRYSTRASVLFFTWSGFKLLSILLYTYNHCTFAWPFYITTAFMTAWAIWLLVQRDWMKMKIVR